MRDRSPPAAQVTIHDQPHASNGQGLFVLRKHKETLMNDPMTDHMTGEEGDGGFTVCLYVSADGKLSVGVERDGQETAEPTPVKGLSQAVEMIVAAVKGGGAMDDAAAQGEFDRAYAPQQQIPAKRFA